MRRAASIAAALVLSVVTASGDKPRGPRSGTYSLRFTNIRESQAAEEGPLRSCGDAGRDTFKAIPRIELAFDRAKRTAIVNGDEWIILERASEMFAAKKLDDCASFTLGFRASAGSTASGTLLYVTKCSEQPASCASIADYAGDYHR